jgi:hypothetical protein
VIGTLVMSGSDCTRLRKRVLNHFSEHRGAGNIGALTNHQEVFILRVIIGLRAREAQERFNGGALAWSYPLNGACDRFDVFGSITTASACKIDEA